MKEYSTIHIGFDESSKEIQEKEELIDELRYQIRRDMEDYKFLHTKAYIYDAEHNKLLDGQLFIGWYTGEDNFAFEGLDLNRAFSNEANWYKEYLERKIKQNLFKLKQLTC